MAGLRVGSIGFSIGVGLWQKVVGLWGGASGFGSGAGANSLPTDGTPTLVLDFVGTDPTYSNTLGLDFTTGTYGSYTADPVAPAYAAFYVWS